jgi:hypothetical protein
MTGELFAYPDGSRSTPALGVAGASYWSARPSMCR